MTAFSGIYPMQYAFFDQQGKLDEALMRLQARRCVAAGAHGLAVLGLATEVNKLSALERQQILRWVSEEIGGRVPLAVTITGTTVEEQVAFAEVAQRYGASWLILQPPAPYDYDAAYLAEFFDKVMTRVAFPLGIQNAPEYIGVGLGADAIAHLARAHSNFALLKGEGPAVRIRTFIEGLPSHMAVFNGRGGLELLDNLRAGCAGIIPATDTFDYQARIFELFTRPAGERAAGAVYEQILPAIVFTMQSLDTLLCYAKRIAAWRLGVSQVHDRTPALTPSEYGLRCARRYAEQLGPLVDPNSSVT